jgi:predicted DNA-binding protein (MmcQ/YjbR family)
MGRDIDQAVRDACLWLPEAEEHLSHGAPNFRVRGKGFATYMVNHHGDGRVALWLAAAAGAQEQYVGGDPRNFFVPPYVGTRGWLGVRLDRGVAWKVVVELVREAYRQVAPGRLQAQIGAPPRIAATARPVRSAVDPLQSPRGRRLLQLMRKICLALPETHEVLQFGHPVWQAGRKSFAWLHCAGKRMTVIFWVGIERQGLLAVDDRYAIPPYLGHNGWISLDVTAGCDAEEVAALALQSYRHFALQRMRRRLAEGNPAGAAAADNDGATH